MVQQSTQRRGSQKKKDRDPDRKEAKGREPLGTFTSDFGRAELVIYQYDFLGGIFRWPLLKTVLHEYGHKVSYAAHISDKFRGTQLINDFNAAYQADRATRSIFAETDLARYFNGKEEDQNGFNEQAFAESFAQYFIGGDNRESMKKYFPKLHEFWRKFEENK